jgi:hypothetical protein
VRGRPSNDKAVNCVPLSGVVSPALDLIGHVRRFITAAPNDADRAGTLLHAVPSQLNAGEAGAPFASAYPGAPVPFLLFANLDLFGLGGGGAAGPPAGAEFRIVLLPSATPDGHVP